MRERTISRPSDYFCIIESTRDELDLLDEEHPFEDITPNAVLLTLMWGSTIVATRTLRCSTRTPLHAFGIELDEAPAFEITIERGRATVHTPAGEPLPADTRMRIRLASEGARLVVVAEPIFEKRRRALDFWPDSRSASLAILMLVAFPLLAFLMSLRAPSNEPDYDAELERMQYARNMLAAASDHEGLQGDDPRTDEHADAKGALVEAAGASSVRHANEEGTAGDPGRTSDAALLREAMHTNAARRAEEIEQAKTFGMVTLIDHGDDSSHLNAALSKLAQAAAHGTLHGDAIDDAFGEAGLGLSGVGEGGGGRGEGISVGDIGDLGHGSNKDEFGAGIVGGSCGSHSCAGRVGGAHQTRAPSIRCDDECLARVKGRLPPEVVQRVIRQNFGRFRACYENGLTTNPELEGRVELKFVIDRDGSVASAELGEGTTMPNAAVQSCVVATMKRVSFPQPEGGIVTVVYPLVFSVV